MKRAVFQLKLLTPALIAGAHPKTLHGVAATAELRAASIRGQLRWWHRFLGYDSSSEQRIYGAASGNSGQASGVLIRLLDAPTPVQDPKSARALELHPAGGIVEYLAFNLRKDGDQRSAIPDGIEFHVLLQSQRLGSDDWKILLRTMEVFSWLGALGTRSRRCFGALTLLARDGKSSERPSTWSSLLGTGCVEARQVPKIDVSDWRELMRQAGRWLLEQRGIVANKTLLFGTAGSGQRRASAIHLRPDILNGRFLLLAIGRSTDLDQVCIRQESIPI